MSSFNDDLQKARTQAALNRIEEIAGEKKPPVQLTISRDAGLDWLIKAWPTLKHGTNEELAAIISIVETIQRRRQ